MLPRNAAPLGSIASANRPTQHLRVLKDAQLVVDRTVGTRRLYAVNPAAIESLRKFFDRFWTRALAAFKENVEGSAKAKEARWHARQTRP